MVCLSFLVASGLNFYAKQLILLVTLNLVRICILLIFGDSPSQRGMLSYRK